MSKLKFKLPSLKLRGTIITAAAAVFSVAIIASLYYVVTTSRSQDLAQADPVEIEDGSAVSYRMREAAPPHEESVVTFTVADNGSGGTRLEIVQRLIVETPVPANSNGEPVMMAA